MIKKQSIGNQCIGLPFSEDYMNFEPEVVIRDVQSLANDTRFIVYFEGGSYPHLVNTWDLYKTVTYNKGLEYVDVKSWMDVKELVKIADMGKERRT